MKNGQILRAPKVRHRNHACHDFFTASETHSTASRERDAPHGHMRERRRSRSRWVRDCYGALEVCTGLLVAVCFFFGTPFT